MPKYRFEIEVEIDETLPNLGAIQKLGVAIADTVGQHFDHVNYEHSLGVTPRGVECFDFKEA
jgi:hypothetical protein